MRRTLAAVASLALLFGCATLPPPAPRPAPSPPASTTAQSPAAPVPGTPVGTTASGGTIRVNGGPSSSGVPVPAVVDSTPSAEALAVLTTIPEPLGSAATETLSAPPAVAPGTVPRAAEAASPDSADGSRDRTPEVPVPEPTEPLGDRPGSLASAALPESLSVPPPAAAPPDTAARGTPPAATATVSPDSCWRVQLAAPPEPERAERLAEAARSQLSIAAVVEREGGLSKVRTRDCYTAVAAEDLRRRALATGFEGAFRFRKKPR